jgi:hypothetical protein
MDLAAQATLLFSLAVQLLCWLVPEHVLGKVPRTVLGVFSGTALLYSLAVFSLIGAEAMRWRLGFLETVIIWAVVGTAAGGVAGAAAWRHFTHQRPMPPPSVPLGRDPTPPPSAPPSRATQPRTEQPPTSRSVLNVTPDSLMGFFRDHTTAQANQLVAVHIGKWLRVSGTLGDIETDRLDDQSVRLVKIYLNQSSGVLAVFRDQPWIDRLSVLRRDDNITVFGQLKSVGAYSLRLDYCELL